MKNDLFQPGEIRILRENAFMSDSFFGGEQPCTVVRMEHRHGSNRYVLVDLHNRQKTQVLVFPTDLI